MFKKALYAIALLGCIGVLLSACNGVTVDYGQSSLYSKGDMDAAIRLIEHEFSDWDGCKLYSIQYTSDDFCQSELEYCNSLTDDADFVECIVFRTRFRSPIWGGGGWNPNTVYDWGWYLARTDGGAWQLLTWGMP